MGARPADMVLILGDIGEVRKKAEGADDLQRVLRLQRIQCGFEIASRRQILVSAEADRILPDILDGVENCIAALLAYRVAEDAAEQPDVFAKWKVFVFCLDCRTGLHAPPLWSSSSTDRCRKRAFTGDAVQAPRSAGHPSTRRACRRRNPVLRGAWQCLASAGKLRCA